MANGNSVTVAGTCESGATLNVTGAATSTGTCSGGAFSLSVTANADGNNSYSLSQTDTAGNTSATSSFVWTRDTVAPSAPTVVSPTMATNPYVTSDNFDLLVSCENGAQITAINTTDNETYSPVNCGEIISISAASYGTRNFSVTQRDLAGNTSSALTFSWTKDGSPPFTPVLQIPSTVYSSGNTHDIIVTCDDVTPSTVHMTGSGIADPAATCTSSPITLTVNKTSDGTYGFTIW